jgi:hypothetical protein
LAAFSIFAAVGFALAGAGLPVFSLVAARDFSAAGNSVLPGISGVSTFFLTVRAL